MTSLRIRGGPRHRNGNQKSPKLRQRRIKFVTMSRTEESSQRGATAPSGALPDLNPCRHVGWIFQHGACIAVERQSEEIRTRVLVD